MIEIASKIFLCLLISALLGAVIGYLLGRIKKCEKNKTVTKNRKKPLYDYDELSSNNEQVVHKEVAVVAPDAVIKQKISKGIKPITYPMPKNRRADDLKKIQGIGLKVENALYDIGIFHYSQIAEWSDENVEWVEEYLASPGRIKRENWIFQAKALTINTQL